MYYRRKIALALIQAMGGSADKIRFQKLLFLWTQLQKKPAYEFVPYKYGCYSFHANADLMTLIKYALVRDSSEAGNQWILTNDTDYSKMLIARDRATLKVLDEQFFSMETKELIVYVYRNFPYYAINSTIAKKLLDQREFRKVKMSNPSNTKSVLYSIGYEGVSLEKYLNSLIHHNIRVLCDVRRNPKSMKFGFSKNQLKFACNAVGIEYLHLPELGIASSKRKDLKSQSDYDRLFKEYRDSTLVEQSDSIGFVRELLSKHKRVAVTCFEANIHQCHRKHLAEKIAETNSRRHDMVHI